MKAAAPKAAAPKTAAAQDAARSRLAPQVRHRMILDAAVQFFAEKGFEAQTRDLASRLGISQGLIFRYFATKQALVEAVYEDVFVQRWSKDWETRLKDRSIPLKERLEGFYNAYLKAADESHWIRVALYAGLAGTDVAIRYMDTHANRLLKILQKELRAERGLPDRAAVDPVDRELAWHLHSTFLYMLVRKHIHRLPVMDETPAFVALVVSAVLAGLDAGVKAAAAAPAAAPQDPAPTVATPEVVAEPAKAPARPAAKGKAAPKASPAAAPTPAPAAKTRGAAKVTAKAPAAKAAPAKPAAAKAPATKTAAKTATAAKAPATKAPAPKAPAPKAAATKPAAAKAAKAPAVKTSSTPAKAPATKAAAKSAPVKSPEPAPAKAAVPVKAPAKGKAKAPATPVAAKASSLPPVRGRRKR